jgi:hypothetical protein
MPARPRNCQQLLAATTLPSTGVTASVDEVLTTRMSLPALTAKLIASVRARS